MFETPVAATGLVVVGPEPELDLGSVKSESSDGGGEVNKDWL